MSNLEARFAGALDGIIFALVFTAIYWVVGFIIKKLSGKEIRTGTGYTVVIVAGFVSKNVLVSILMNS